MLILAFDTSGLAGSVALLDGSRLLAERVLEPGRRSAQTLAPAIVELLSAQQIEPRQIRLVATTVGPGSFTGLRVGVTTAKTFAYAVGAEVIGLSTLETIANQVPLELLSVGQSEVLAVLDAQRQELFLGRFRSEGSPAANDDLPRLTRLEADRIVAADAWLASLPANAIVTGTGLAQAARPPTPRDLAIAPQRSGSRKRPRWDDWPGVSTQTAGATTYGRSHRFICGQATPRRKSPRHKRSRCGGGIRLPYAARRFMIRRKLLRVSSFVVRGSLR